MKNGVIYAAGRPTKEIKVAQSILILRTLAGGMGKMGLGLVIIAIAGIVSVYVPLGWAELKYAFTRTTSGRAIGRVESTAVVQRQIITNQTDKPGWDVPDNNYSIYIPKIFAISRVITNVDPNNPKIYMAALKQGVAEAAGLAHPGQTGTTYLFAHSVGSRADFVRYNAVFYLLDKLTEGDNIEIVYGGKLMKYAVVDREIVAPTDTRFLVPQQLAEKLVLQTCYPPGTTWKRLIIVAKRQL